MYVELQLRMPAVRIQFVFLRADSSGASEDRRGRTGTSFRYAGVDDESTLNIRVRVK